MPTVTQYQHRLSELNLGLLDQAERPQEAVAEMEGHLRQMAEDVAREIQVIRAQYHTRISSASAGGAGGAISSGRQVSSAQRRVDETARLETERDEKIAPFEEIRQQVETALTRLTGETKDR